MTPGRPGILLTTISTVFILTFFGCASTTIKSAWKDPEYPFGSIKTMLVLGVTEQTSSRRYFEDQFVKTLKTYGVTAMPGYRLAPDGGMPTEASVKTYVQEKGIQAVMVTRIISKRTVERYVPPVTTSSYVPQTVSPGAYNQPSYYNNYNNNYNNYNNYNNGYYGYYQNSAQIVTTTSPGYTVKDELVDSETRVFDATSAHVIWAGTTETLMGPDLEGLIRGYVSLISSSIFKEESKQR